MFVLPREVPEAKGFGMEAAPEVMTLTVSYARHQTSAGKYNGRLSPPPPVRFMVQLVGLSSPVMLPVAVCSSRAKWIA